MGVSYSLDVSNLSNLDSFSRYLTSVGDEDTGNGGGVFGDGRFVNSTLFWDIFPTGEYIIRKGMYINGSYVYVGSYKAYCYDLFGAGNHGYAWDGFILFTNAYSLEKFPLFLEFDVGGTQFTVADSRRFGFLPMRMMFEVNPGVIGDATAIANDSSVGLYGLDAYKFQPIVEGGDRDINIITCGRQRINPAAESVPTGMDYIGNLYMGKLLIYDGNDTEQVRYIPNWEQPNVFAQITWRANQPNHRDKTDPNGRFGSAWDLDEVLTLQERINQGGTGFYSIDDYNLGLPRPAGAVAKNLNIYPRSFFDITCISEQPYNTLDFSTSVFCLAGDAALDTNNNGTINKTVPAVAGCTFDYFSFVIGGQPLGPYMSFNPSGSNANSAEPTYRWDFEDVTPSYNLDGAYAVLCSQPYETVDIAQPFDVETQPETLVAVNNVDFGGTTYGVVYGVGGSFIVPQFNLYPLFVQGGGLQTASGYTAPTKWYGKAVQQRTFSISEEDIAKQGQTNTETGVFTPSNYVSPLEPFNPYNDKISVFDSDADEYIGFISNYQRYGAFNLIDDPALIPPAQAGSLTGSGYGFLGIKDGTGPVAFMFDSGSPYYDDQVGFDYTVVARGEGGNINSNILNNPTSTTRKIINCGWDNDRDQWLFLTSDTNDVSVVSVSSDFSTASNNVGFLDQTANFKDLETGTDAGFYFPISMSNSLDGWVWFGKLDDGVVAGIKPANLGSSQTITVNRQSLGGIPYSVTYDIYPNATTEIRRITGTTGRTAKVWVDYVLFDGVDSVIATKLKNLGLKVNIENVEWFKRKIIRTGDLNIKSEEIEEWVRQQQQQYKDMLKAKERQGRIRKRKSQVSAYQEGMEEQINPDFMDDEEKDFLNEFIPKDRPPSPTEKKLEKKRKGGYEPKQSSYYDEVFEDEP